MAQCGKRSVLDAIQRREILALLAVGCSRAVAAAYVGCSPATIQKTAGRDPKFAEALRRAEHQVEVGYLRNIQKAATQEKYWRAAAWALERKNPTDYARRAADVLTLDQVKQIMAQCAAIVIEEVPVPEYRKSILKRVRQLVASIVASKAKGTALRTDDDTQQ